MYCTNGTLYDWNKCNKFILESIMHNMLLIGPCNRSILITGSTIYQPIFTNITTNIYGYLAVAYCSLYSKHYTLWTYTNVCNFGACCLKAHNYLWFAIFFKIIPFDALIFLWHDLCCYLLKINSVLWSSLTKISCFYRTHKLYSVFASLLQKSTWFYNTCKTNLVFWGMHKNRLGVL